MRKAFKLQDLDCANCAAKMENAISNDEAERACRKIEPDCVILR